MLKCKRWNVLLASRRYLLRNIPRLVKCTCLRATCTVLFMNNLTCSSYQPLTFHGLGVDVQQGRASYPSPFHCRNHCTRKATERPRQNFFYTAQWPSTRSISAIPRHSCFSNTLDLPMSSTILSPENGEGFDCATSRTESAHVSKSIAT